MAEWNALAVHCIAVGVADNPASRPGPPALLDLDQQLSIGDAARLMALANLATADAVISVWESKHHFNFWRPITAVREADTDGNPRTVADPAWTPFIQSVYFPAGSQTPPYPDHTSGADGLTAAMVTTLQLFFRTDKLHFEIHKRHPPRSPSARTRVCFIVCRMRRTKSSMPGYGSAFTSARPTRRRDGRVRASPGGCSRGSCGQSTTTMTSDVALG